MDDKIILHLVAKQLCINSSVSEFSCEYHAQAENQHQRSERKWHGDRVLTKPAVAVNESRTRRSRFEAPAEW